MMNIKNATEETIKRNMFYPFHFTSILFPIERALQKKALHLF